MREREIIVYCYKSKLYIYIYIYIYIYNSLIVTVIKADRAEFKSRSQLFAFPIAIIPLRKVCFQLFSYQLWWKSRATWALKSWYCSSEYSPMLRVLYSLHNGLTLLHKYTSTRASDGVPQPAWHNHVWYHLCCGRIVTTPLDSQLPVN